MEPGDVLELIWYALAAYLCLSLLRFRLLWPVPLPLCRHVASLFATASGPLHNRTSVCFLLQCCTTKCQRTCAVH